MKTLARATLTALALLSFSVTAAHAGSLGPRLTGLAAGHMPKIRTTFEAFKPALPDLFSLRLDTAGRVQVYILPASRSAPLPGASELTALGAVKLLPSNALHLVQAWVPVSELRLLAALPDVARVTVPVYAVVRQVTHQGFSPAPRGTTAPLPSGLAIDSAAVQAMQADRLQNVNANGAGIKVGVISGDNTGLTASQAAGYLPSTVWSDPTYPGTTPFPGDSAEGTAMLEVVHAMAPNASLGYCGQEPTSADFLTCYQDLVQWGANVIVDDLGFPATDMFTTGSTQDGSFAAAIAKITQANPKITFTSDAGNDAQDYFQGLYTPGPGATINGTAYASLMDFGAALGGASNTRLAVTFHGTYPFTPDLEWNDPIPATNPPPSYPDALTLYLENSGGTVLATGTLDATTDDGRPDEELTYTPASVGETDFLVVACQSCADPVSIKLLGWGDGALQFGTSTTGSVYGGQKVAPGVLEAVAAGVNTQSPLSVGLEGFSGIGPFLYGDYSAISTFAKPDLTGVDCVVVSGAGGFSASSPAPTGGVYFDGTSAATPNVAALIADLMSADPGQANSFYYTALENTANQTAFSSTPYTVCQGGTNPLITGYTPGNSGAGLAQGYAALQSFFTFPSTSVTAPVQVADGTTGSYTAPANLAINFTAAVKAGTNAASAANCVWSEGSSTQTGTTAAWTFPAAGSYTVAVNCPDSQGIKDPSPPSIKVTAQNIAPPTVTTAGSSSTGFNLTLTGYEPLSVTATSSNISVLPNSDIVLSSGCGVSTLTCTVTLSPVTEANGATTVTVTATDPFGQSGNTTVSETYVPPPPTVAITGAGQSGFYLTLTGFQPLTVSAVSSNASIIPNSGIAISTGCGSSSLSCTVALTPAAQANGSTTITVTVTDSLSQKASAATGESYTYTPPPPPPPSKGDGGGSMGIWGLLLLGGLLLLRGVVCAPRKVRAQLLGAVTLCVLTVGSVWAGTLDPRLAALMNQRASQTTNSALPQSPSAPRIDSASNVQVYIIPISPTAPLPSTDELAALGAVQVMPSDALHLVQAWVPITKLQALAALPDVGRITVPAYGVPQHTQTSAPPSVSHKSLAGGSLGIFALLALAGLTAARFFAPFRRCCSAAASQGWKTNS